MIKELVKIEAVDINQLLLSNYRKMNIDEIELVILMHLFVSYVKGKQTLKFQALAQKMSIGINECTVKMQNLINKGFVEINIDYDKNGKAVESFDLSPTCERLESFYIEHNDKNNYIIILEKEMGTTLSPIDLAMALEFEKYPNDVVVDAIKKAKQQGKLTCSYVSAILNKIENLDNSVDKEKTDMVKKFMSGIKR